MMIHHGPEKYDVAVSRAGELMRDKLHAKIEAARPKAVAAMERIAREIPTDHIVPDKIIEMSADTAELVATYASNRQERIHPWALGQMSDELKLPRAYVSGLMAAGEGREWARDLAARTFTEHFAHTGKKHLTRTVDGQTRGFLTPRYQRRHPGELLDVFVQGCRKYNLLPYEAWCSDTKHAMRAVLDGVLEPVPNECLGLGVYYSESPYGNGATEINITVERMWCSNTAIIEQSLRSVHLGKRLGDEVEWSEATYKADTRLVSSQIQDLLETSLSNDAIKKLEAGVVRAHELKIEPMQLETFLKNSHLQASDVDDVLAAYRSADVELMPAGNTAWRASNAISFFAGTIQEDDERQFVVQKLAGRALTELAKVDVSNVQAARRRRR